jgi:integrase
VKLVAREAGVEDVAPHRLRHVAVATVNDNTGNLRAAQDFARHMDSSSTETSTPGRPRNAYALPWKPSTTEGRAFVKPDQAASARRSRN